MSNEIDLTVDIDSIMSNKTDLTVEDYLYDINEKTISYLKPSLWAICYERLHLDSPYQFLIPDTLQMTSPNNFLCWSQNGIHRLMRIVT